jgi:hypothetical protein
MNMVDTVFGLGHRQPCPDWWQKISSTIRAGRFPSSFRRDSLMSFYFYIFFCFLAYCPRCFLALNRSHSPPPVAPLW